MAKKKAPTTRGLKKHPGKILKPEVTHTIAFAFADGAWNYTIDPPQRPPYSARKARIKRRDRLQWKCSDGRWTVYFKGRTPLVDGKQGTGDCLASVSGPRGKNPVGGTISREARVGDRFKFGVILVLDRNGKTVTNDPEIIIESEYIG